MNEAVRTFLYLPIYFASDSGCFARRGLDVSIVTGGTATNSFAALVSGEADVAIADPMYVPISREHGNEARVVGQVVGRIAVWGLTMDPNVVAFDAASLRRKTIATHPRPMTAYVYAMRAVRDAGLNASDVNILQLTPGSEIVPFLDGKADFVLTLEPNVSRAVHKGARVVLSYPQKLGDQIFTGILMRNEYVRKNRGEAVAFVSCVQDALSAIHSRPEAAIPVARKWFPGVDADVAAAAVARLIDEEVLPKSVAVTEQSWQRAMTARIDAGDLKTPAPLAENADIGIMMDAIQSQSHVQPTGR